MKDVPDDVRRRRALVCLRALLGVAVVLGWILPERRDLGFDRGFGVALASHGPTLVLFLFLCLYLFLILVLGRKHQVVKIAITLANDLERGANVGEKLNATAKPSPVARRPRQPSRSEAGFTMSLPSERASPHCVACNNLGYLLSHVTMLDF